MLKVAAYQSDITKRDERVSGLCRQRLLRGRASRSVFHEKKKTGLLLVYYLTSFRITKIDEIITNMSRFLT